MIARLLDLGFEDSDVDNDDVSNELVILNDARVISVNRLADIAQESQIDLQQPMADEPEDVEMVGYENGLWSLVQAAFDLTGLPDDKWVQKRKESGLWSQLLVSFMFMIAGIDSKILEHVVRGDLPKALLEPEN
ncbi:hypothetical protein SBOR_8704 [Sclerotinia borealis F-4128]|uniref:Uncharacterized protein n=1 Tax=Sclerotinia borealis (strain F-4128) TaxID=1432307 RepID=W9C5C7_SCLBF|nr:hypothetical protein SBOR_8704 [Sclerotinia borealis F-4128]